MGSSRNPGVLAVTAGVALAVLFALMGVTAVLPGQAGFGLAIVALAVSVLIYIFYSRSNAVEKTGYGSLIFIIAVAFIIPLLLVNQQQAQATQAAAQYDLTLQRGAALFGQYCASCHGFQGQGLSAPKLNNNPDVNKLSSDDLTRIISAGVPNPGNLTTFQMPAWSQEFGGSLTTQDIAYLVALIRSSDKTYTSAQHLEAVNGFSYVLQSLTDPTQIAEYHSELKSGSKPPANTFTDLTTQKVVHIDAIDVSSGPAPWGWQPVGVTTPNIIIKVGTTVIWGNKSSAPHNVYSGPPNNPDGKFHSPGILAANSTDTFSFTFTTPGDYPYYCAIHPVMVGYITVVP